MSVLILIDLVAPTVQEVKIRSKQNDFFLEIYGFNFGQQKSDLKSVEANLVIIALIKDRLPRPRLCEFKVFEMHHRKKKTR